MNIRTQSKDHLAELAPPLVAVPPPAAVMDTSDPLRFATLHPTKPATVDLYPLALGEEKQRGGARWNGPFSARRALIEQLAPAIHDDLRHKPRTSTGGFVSSLRRWWRLFDALEERASAAGGVVTRIQSVAQFTELHGQAALDANFSAHDIADLGRVANTTRQALGLRPLYWRGPGKRDGKRHLPPPEKVSLIWNALKRHWFSTLDRWRHAEELVAGTTRSDADASLLQSYRRFDEAARRLSSDGKTFPTPSDMRDGLLQHEFTVLGLNLGVAYAGFFPTATDVRIAFLLCLASTGWNPQTMLDLPVNADDLSSTRTPFLISHPQDESRYVLQGIKSRGNSDHVVYGDWKTDRSPGVILKTLVARTWPLRVKLQREAEGANQAYQNAIKEGLPSKRTTELKHEFVKLQEGLRSPWLYCTARGDVEWLHESNYRQLPTDVTRKKTVLSWVVDQINESRHLEGAARVPYIVPGDFRDAFAAFVWRSSGGSVLHVMKALGHRALRTTFIYLNNTAVNAESAKVFRTFSNALWKEIRVTRRLDMTVLAKLTQDGVFSVEQSARLNDYRALKRSRIGVACKDPLNPPERIAPGFEPNGRRQCPIQRCTLCFEHGVILPDSLDGLAMRMAELEWLKEHMPIEAFTGREFQQEYDNTQAALTGFEPEAVETALEKWRGRIARGEHRVVEFQRILKAGVSA